MSRPLQVTCGCHAYHFPHRIGGGRCSGGDWAASYREIDGACCEQCNCLNNGFAGCGGERSGSCDVIEGLESIRLCEGYQDYLNSQTDQRLPVPIEVFLSGQYGAYGEVWA